MGIKIDNKVKGDLQKLHAFIQKKDGAWVNEYQEKIFAVLYMILNEDFRNKVEQLRKKYSIPEEWHTKEKLTDKDWNYWEKWVEETEPTPPRTAYDEEIHLLCQEVGIDPIEYGEFVVGYLYFGDVNIIRSMGFNIQTDDEYRYKAKLETEHGLGLYDIPAITPQKGYIRFYKDTTKNQLIKFIEERWEYIERLKKDLPKYPHTKKYGRFKRDVQIYILHLLGQNTPSILDELTKSIKDIDRELTEEENSYFLDEPSVRQVIKDIDDRIKQKLQGVSKT